MLTRELIPRRNRSPMATRRRQSRYEILARFNFLRAVVSMGHYKPHRWWEHKHPTYRKWEFRNEKD
jgi:hypothetical protein